MAIDYQNCFGFARLHIINATHCRDVFEISCLVKEIEIRFRIVVSHLDFTLDFHTCFEAAKMNCVAFLNSNYLII